MPRRSQIYFIYILYMMYLKDARSANELAQNLKNKIIKMIIFKNEKYQYSLDLTSSKTTYFLPTKHIYYIDISIITRTKTSIDSNQEEEKRMRERKWEKVKREKERERGQQAKSKLFQKSRNLHQISYVVIFDLEIN